MFHALLVWRVLLAVDIGRNDASAGDEVSLESKAQGVGSMG